MGVKFWQENVYQTVKLVEEELEFRKLWVEQLRHLVYLNYFL